MVQKPADPWPELAPRVLLLEQRGLVTRTFRRLDPDRQRQVVEAILEEAAEHGPEGLSVKRVAARAGASVGALYGWFPSREALMGFAIALCVDELVEGMAAWTPMLAEMPLRDGLTAWVLGGLEWGEGRAGLVRFFARAAYGADPALGERVVAPVAAALLASLRAMLQAAADRGEVRPDVDLEGASRALHATLLAVGDSALMPWLSRYFLSFDEEHPLERTLAAAVDLAVRGLSPGGDR